VLSDPPATNWPHNDHRPLHRAAENHPVCQDEAVLAAIRGRQVVPAMTITAGRSDGTWGHPPVDTCSRSTRPDRVLASSRPAAPSKITKSGLSAGRAACLPKLPQSAREPPPG
jgi:hypothetical protein